LLRPWRRRRSRRRRRRLVDEANENEEHILVEDVLDETDVVVPKGKGRPRKTK
jgi:hypothetical protein